MTPELHDELQIRRLIERWAVWRDAGDWERFRSVWHDDGRMMATWFQGTADEFIALARSGYFEGLAILRVQDNFVVQWGDPNAAEEAARIVEKVRINPGNYADKKRFENFEYTPAEYQAELERIYKKFAPLVKVCKG